MRVRVLGALVLAGCGGRAASSPPSPEPVLVIRGALTHTQRSALPPDAQVVVELRDAAAPEGASVTAESRAATDGAQVPLPFTLVVPRRSLVPGTTYVVRGGVRAGGFPAFASEPVGVDVARDTVDVGSLVMTPYQVDAFMSVLRCGDEEVRLGAQRDHMVLTAGGRRYPMREVRTASGARYEAVDDPSTTFWSKGRQATVVVAGRELPTCELVTP
ncbi:MAG: YbaY family lipoprotein [Gemmatimonadales bacterium]|jgi:uncharacterized lipoprotein YbaY|nr:YbaY family lipoprotein [Gemmatimonadales bacterium]